jgi:hypothetical protein
MRNKKAKALRREALLYARLTNQTAHKVRETVVKKALVEYRLPGLDPMTGKPITFQRVEDRVVIQNVSGVRFFYQRMKKLERQGLIRLRSLQRLPASAVDASNVEVACRAR